MVLRSIVYCIVHIAQVATLPAYVALLQRVVEYVVTLLPVKIANGDASAALHYLVIESKQAYALQHEHTIPF